jgi:hypothetical protein
VVDWAVLAEQVADRAEGWVRLVGLVGQVMSLPVEKQEQ